MIDPEQRAPLHQRLDASRAVLLAALEGVTERDFATDLGGETVTGLLVRLAAEERAAVAALRRTVDESKVSARPLPPQAIHGLAGARYSTKRYLDDPQATLDAAEPLVAGIEEREAEAARRIRERPPLAPLPEIPVVPPRPA